MTLVYQHPKYITKSVSTKLSDLLPDQRPMTIRDLMDQLEAIADQSTPVYLESGEPVHYTCHGMNQNETRFFIGVM